MDQCQVASYSFAIESCDIWKDSSKGIDAVTYQVDQHRMGTKP